LLLPPSLRDWLAEDRLAWFVLDIVDQLDLEPFYGVYRRDGWGAAAHDPRMMVALLVYAYCIGERSSRKIERRCREDVAFRVITANQVPDHATIARFRVRHEAALGDLFGQVLALCADGGMVSVGVIAVDGTKVHANASRDQNLDHEQIARKILEEAAQIDEPRTSVTARRAVMSCRRRSLAARAAGRGCARPLSALRPSAPPTPSRCRARAPSGWPRPSVGSRKSSRSSAKPTPTMRPTGRAV
jgi:transposase